MEAAPPRRWVGIAFAFALTLAVLVAALLYRPDDAPFRPHNDAEIIERVAPGQGADPAADALRALEQQLARSPNDVRLALQVARQQLEGARRTGDARLLSYAEAALAPWWNDPAPALPVLVMRATIKQTRHEFPASLIDLDAAVRMAPNEPQAWLTRATVLGVLARYDEARESCAHLRGIAPPIFEATCEAGLEGVSDPTNLGAARAHLTTLLVTPGLPTADLEWGQSVLGEAMLYRGDGKGAEAYLRVALAADATDVYTRGLLADLLIDTDRAAEAMSLVDAKESNEVLLLRRAIAAVRTHASEAKDLQARLRARNDELRARGDTTHRREEARLVMSVEDDPVAAVPIAVANFLQQHEPWDARVLIEAAAAATERAPARRAEFIAAAKPALEWLAKTGCAWAPLVKAAATLGGAR
jgi:hypothetical protein